jgi:ribonucleoside-diphosphate reductase alpha chain
VSKFVGGSGPGIDWVALGETVKWSVRFLDNVIDATSYPAPAIHQATLGNRKIGLGMMGVADALLLLGIRYDSDEAAALAGKLSQFIQETAHQASQDLAAERGSFPNWAGSVWDTEHHRPMRNACCTTIAPTGSLSILAQCSAGIEPIYSLACRRLALDGREFIYVHPLLERVGQREGWMTDAARGALLKGVPAREIQGIPRPLAEALVAAHEVSAEWHVRIQAAFQQHVDNAVSKTVNLPTDASAADVDKVFRMAFELGCKGTTVYRDGARQGQTFSKACGHADTPKAHSRTPRPRPRVTAGMTIKFRMGCGTLFVTVNHDEQGMCEVFANLGKAGGCPSQSEATCRAVSAALRSGVEPKVFIEQLRGIRCPSTVIARKNGDDVNVLSCPDAIARAIEEAMGAPAQTGPIAFDNTCPDCGAVLRKQEGCLVCTCGFSKCN